MARTKSFAIRGVIEGFYGKPWTSAERMKMMSFLHEQGYNAYFYSPKDDPYLRERWNENHPSSQFTRLTELVHHAKELQLDFYYCISPGLSMEYSNDQHIQSLLDKYRQLFDKGVRHFGLFFDDIPLSLMHKKDRQAFEHLSDAHAHVVLQVWNQIQEWSYDVKLSVCPTQYCGMGNEAYIVRLGRQLPTSILIFWTGRFVCSPYLTDRDAARFEQYTGHQPLYWDNYPVNDLAMADELHIGPLLHRDPHLYRHASGYVANAMELAESSKIPFITIADYLRDPENYDPEKSWQRAIREVAGEQNADAFLKFADNVRSSFLNDQESTHLMEAFHEFRFHYLHQDREHAITRLMHTFREMERNANDLLHRMENQKLQNEIKGWLKKYWHWSKVGQSAVSLIHRGQNGQLLQAGYQYLRLKRWLRRAEQLPHKVCGSVVRLFCEAVLQEVSKQRRN